MSTPSGATSSLLPTVYLLVGGEDGGGGDNVSAANFAREVCVTLRRRFGGGTSEEDLADRVVVRSSSVPPDVLLRGTTAAAEDDGKDDDSEGAVLPAPEPVLFVLLGPTTPTTSVLETSGCGPVVRFALDKTTTTPAKVALEIAKLCSLSGPAVELRRQVRKAAFQDRQARLVEDAQLKTKSWRYEAAIERCLASPSSSIASSTTSEGGGNSSSSTAIITGDNVSVEGRMRGKVRDRYVCGKFLALVTTDRQSGFDRQLALVPFKGAVLNLTSAYWFRRTRHIVPNHLVAAPHPNVSVVKQCQPFPIEFVVRSYMTGSTSTSIWKNYQNGVRNYCGHALPEGMTKNQKLERNLLTPTTKEEEHDRPISAAEIVAEKWMTREDFDVCADAALRVFALGQKVASQRGLILVDTKYEFGRDPLTGDILLIDEVHTPDSSRYWLASTYEQRIAEGKEPDNIDKEFLRLWFAEHCDPYKDEVLPEPPRELVAELSRRYITLYEMITGKDFDFTRSSAAGGGSEEDAISEAIKSFA